MNFHSFLLVDVGNSILKWAVAPIPGEEKETALDHPLLMGEMPTAEATAERLQSLRENFPGHYLVFCSVVPRISPLLHHAFKRGYHQVTAQSPDLGLEFDYPKPSEIGADRLAASVAVQADKVWPAIIVQCGTATAFSVLDAQGHFCGGAIAPGPQTQLTALVGATAQLPNISLHPPRSFLGRSTEDAIRAGIFLSFQGGVHGTIRHLSAELSHRRPRLVLTGGNAHYLTGTLEMEYKLRPLLVFEGLRIIGLRTFTDP